MPIVLTDEKKYTDCVDILDQLEKWVHEIYTALGLCSSEPEPFDNNPPVIGDRSRPDQPVKIPCSTQCLN